MNVEGLQDNGYKSTSLAKLTVLPTYSTNIADNDASESTCNCNGTQQATDDSRALHLPVCSERITAQIVTNARALSAYPI